MNIDVKDIVGEMVQENQEIQQEVQEISKEQAFEDET